MQLKQALDTLQAESREYKSLMQKFLFDRINQEPAFVSSGIKIHCDKNGMVSDKEKAKLDYLSEGAKQFYQNEIANYETKLKSDEEYINKHKIEFHRKFTLSAACLILFFIGAPLGAIIRKGGLGMPVVVSTLAFIIYHIVGQVGENAALEGGMPIWLGMWLSSLIFLPIGIVLTMKATSDSAVLSSEGWTKFFERIKQFTKTKKTKQDNENTASLL